MIPSKIYSLIQIQEAISKKRPIRDGRKKGTHYGEDYSLRSTYNQSDPIWTSWTFPAFPRCRLDPKLHGPKYRVSDRDWVHARICCL